MNAIAIAAGLQPERSPLEREATARLDQMAPLVAASDRHLYARRYPLVAFCWICAANSTSPCPRKWRFSAAGNDSVICETVRPTLSSLDVDCAAHRLRSGETAGSDDGRQAVEGHRSTFRRATWSSANPPISWPSRTPTWPRRCVIIRESACTGIDVARVAEAKSACRGEALERRFRQHLGRTPKAEIMRVRHGARQNAHGCKRTKPARASRATAVSLPLEYFTKVFRRMSRHETAGLPQDAADFARFAQERR